MRNLNLLAEAVKIMNTPLEIYYSCAIANYYSKSDSNGNTIVMSIKECIPKISNTDILFSMLKGFIYTDRTNVAELLSVIMVEETKLYEQYNNKYGFSSGFSFTNNAQPSEDNTKYNLWTKGSKLTENNILDFLGKWNSISRDRSWLRGFIRQLHVHFTLKEKIEAIRDSNLYGGSKYHYDYITNKEHYINIQ